MALHRQKRNHTDISRVTHTKFSMGENPMAMNNVPINDRAHGPGHMDK